MRMEAGNSSMRLAYGAKYRNSTPGANHDIGYPLDPEECAAVKEIYYNSVAIFTSGTWFKEALFKTPFTVRYGDPDSEDKTSFPLRQEVQEKIIEEYWMVWLNELYDRLKMDGIVPYYYKQVKLYNKETKATRGKKPSKSYHLVPIIPPAEAGTVYTYMDGKEQAYYYVWNTNNNDEQTAGNEDGSIYFIVRHKPTLRGSLTSPIKALVKDYLALDTIEMITLKLAEALAEPLHVIEYAPDLKNAGTIVQAQGARHGGEANGSLAQGGDGASINFANMVLPEGTTSLNYINNMRQKSGSDGRTPFSDLGVSGDLGYRLMGKADMSSAMQQYLQTRYQRSDDGTDGSVARRFNAQRNVRRLQRGTAPDFVNNDMLSADERFLYGNTRNIMKLEPYEHYVAAARPASLNLDQKFYTENFNRQSSAIMDFPVWSLAKDTKTGSVSSNSLSLLEGRIKSETAFFKSVIKKAFTIAYLPLLEDRSEKETKKIVDKITSIDVATQPKRREWVATAIYDYYLSIVFPRTPEYTLDEFLRLYQHRLISKRDLYQFSLDIYGLAGISGSSQPTREYLEAIERLYPIPTMAELHPPPQVAAAGSSGGGGAKSKSGKKPAAKPDKTKTALTLSTTNKALGSEEKTKKRKVQASEAVAQEEEEPPRKKTRLLIEELASTVAEIEEDEDDSMDLIVNN
jgi:hypothetical protein